MGIFTLRRTESEQTWLKLDNAAKIFPTVSNQVRTSVFRLSVELREPVHLLTLQKAMEEAFNALPYFRMHLRKGFFWYWLEPSETNPIVHPDLGIPCRAFYMKSRNHLLVRVLAKTNRISVEFSHILTDGGGAMQFLQRLVCAYGRIRGWDIPTNRELNLVYKQTPELVEDGYKKFFSRRFPRKAKIPLAFHLPMPLNRNPVFRTTTAELSVNQILKTARSNKVTLTEYLASVYLFTLQKFFLQSSYSIRRRRNIVRVQIPVNLRALFDHNTLRNFALFVMPEITPNLGAYTFDEILTTVHHYMQLETDKRQIRRIITRNVGSEKNPLIRIIPLFIKIGVLRIVFGKSGPLLYSGVLTNLGAVRLPEAYDPYMEGFRFTAPPPDPRFKINAAVVSYKDRLLINFGSLIESNEFEQEFIRFLIQQDIQVKILTQ